MSILGGAGANAAPLWAMAYEDAAPLFATEDGVCVIVYYYDEVEKQILPSFGYTLKRAIGRSGGGEAAKGFDALCSALGKPPTCALCVVRFVVRMQDARWLLGSF